MANERDDQEPRIRVIDRRGLSEEPESERPAPKLEIVGGSSSGSGTSPMATQAASGAGQENVLSFGTPSALDEGFEDDDVTDLSDEPELTEAEAAQMEAQFEAEQFAQLEAQMGRPLTEREKGQVREEMDRQAQQMAKLEVAPLILNTLSEISARAAIHLGLMPNPYTRLIARNDTQARIAIEAFGALYEVIKSQLPAEINREYARVLNDLRVNYASLTGTQLSSPQASGPQIIAPGRIIR